jgi:serine acetyltransferase
VGASIGAGSVVVTGISIGRWALVGAGSVVTHDVPDFALVFGQPARVRGWVDRHGHRVHICATSEGCVGTCEQCGATVPLAREAAAFVSRL